MRFQLAFELHGRLKRIDFLVSRLKRSSNSPVEMDLTHGDVTMKPRTLARQRGIDEESTTR